MKHNRTFSAAVKQCDPATLILVKHVMLLKHSLCAHVKATSLVRRKVTFLLIYFSDRNDKNLLIAHDIVCRDGAATIPWKIYHYKFKMDNFNQNFTAVCLRSKCRTLKTNQSELNSQLEIPSVQNCMMVTCSYKIKKFNVQVFLADAFWALFKYVLFWCSSK